MKKTLLISFIAFGMQSQCLAQTFDTIWANRFQTVLDSVISAIGCVATADETGDKNNS